MEFEIGNYIVLKDEAVEKINKNWIDNGWPPIESLKKIKSIKPMKIISFHPLNRKRIMVEYSNSNVEEIYSEHYRFATEVEIKSYNIKNIFKK